MTRADFQQLAEMRLKDAEILLTSDRFGGAYYLAGYVVECALKSCIARAVREHDFPDKRTVLDSYTHDLEKLASVAGLKANLAEKGKNDSRFLLNWSIVRDWSEESRYELKSAQAAQALFEAVSHPEHGVLEWLRHHW